MYNKAHRCRIICFGIKMKMISEYTYNDIDIIL